MLVAARRLPVLETIVVVLAAVALATFAVLEQQGAQNVSLVDTYSSYDAAGGGYRAFYELLQREGIRVQRFEERPGFLDPSVDTLVYAEPLDFDPRQIASSMNDARALEGWVRSGGRLLYFGFDDGAAKEKVLALPFSTTASGGARRPSLAAALQAAGVARVGAVAGSTRWRLPHGRARTLFDDGRGPVIVSYPFGRGAVTAVIDQRLFDNGNLALGDRARLAFALAMPRRAGGEVWFDETVHGYLQPEHWWSIVPLPFVVALGVAALALLVALAGAAVRLGPPIAPRPRDDRTSADFIDGLSSLFERGHALRKAMQDASNATARAVARTLGAGDDSSAEQIGERIENIQTRAEFRTMLQLAESGPADSANLVRTVALAQRLRKEFAPHGRQRN
jgi:hypothetical protein